MLNEKQLEVINNDAKAYCVIASAGSGKTSTLTHKIAKYLEDGIKPDELMVVTFTNKAANELKERIRKLLPDINLSGMYIGTFHSIAYRFLIKHYESVNLSKDFTIVDQSAQLKIICELLEQHKIVPTEGKVDSKQAYEFVNYINRQKDYAQRHDSTSKNSKEKFYGIYEKYCKKHNIVDFGELMIRSFELLRIESFKNYYSNKFKYVFCDEFQDTNCIQYEWLKLLTLDNQNLFIVGDDYQSIYKFRGAIIDNMWQFQKYYDHELFKLEQNYRSTKTIVNAGQNIISNNSKQMSKNVWTDNEHGNKIILKVCHDNYMESSYVISEIKKLLNSGIDAEEIAVLYRNNMHSGIIEQLLKENHIKYHVKGAYSFYGREEIKLLLSYLKLLDGNYNDVLYCINKPSRKIGKKIIDEIKLLKNDDNTYKEIIESLLDKHKALKQFHYDISQLSKIDNMVDMVETIIKKYELHKWFNDTEKSENINEFINIVKNHEGTLHDFLVTVLLSSDEYSTKKGIQLITAHGSKGLEFSRVFVIGCEDSNFPSFYNHDSLDDIEEERRLFYVAITRTKHQLYLTFPQTKYVWGKQMQNTLSRFVSEINSEYIQKII